MFTCVKQRRSLAVIALALALVFSLIAIPEQSLRAAEGNLLPGIRNNLSVNGVKSSSMIVTDDGYMRVYIDKKNVLIEYLDKSFNVLRKKSLDRELYYWGGFYAVEDAYYIAEGQPNPEEKDDAEVIRVTKYDKNWKLIAENKDPFKGYEIEVNHIADIDVYNNELYIGAEYFMDGVGKNIQIAVYDGDTLELKRTFPFEASSGQLECSGIAVNPDNGTVWMCSWVGEESGRYLYDYDLKTGKYLGKVHMQMPPQWLQGIAYYNGYFYMTADDGTADDNEPDHLYRTKIEDGKTDCIVTLERTFDDVTKQGEIEGLTFDKAQNRLLLLYNRGARIVLGMPKGFYEGYDHEISEVFVYNMTARK